MKVRLKGESLTEPRVSGSSRFGRVMVSSSSRTDSVSEIGWGCGANGDPRTAVAGETCGLVLVELRESTDLALGLTFH